MTHDDVHMAVFGSFDGLTSAVGVVLAALLTQADVFVLALALAVSAAVSMASGEWLADDVPDDRARRAVVMGISTLVTSVLPALPFVLGSGAPEIVCSAVIVLAIACAVAEIRQGDRLESYKKTLIVLGLSLGLATGASLLGQGITA